MPFVSIIVPCYNEQKTILLLLDALYKQTYPLDKTEVIIADGMSTDRTREKINLFQEAHPDITIRVVDNHQKTIPSGLNTAINNACGSLIIRLDAHSVPRPDYVARCVANLERGLGDNVGGIWEIHPGGSGWQARCIAFAAAHPLAVGDAHYRHANRAQLVDTVPFGAFRRALVDQIGLFDESLLTNEDYEFNTRILKNGGKIWLDPEIRSIYYARSTYAALARQYWRYGFWKVRMLRRYPRSLRWRQTLPPVFVLSLLFLLINSIFFSIARWAFMIESIAYILVLLAVGIQAIIKKQDSTAILGVPLAIATMHLSWGSAFLWSLIVR